MRLRACRLAASVALLAAVAVAAVPGCNKKKDSDAASGTDTPPGTGPGSPDQTPPRPAEGGGDRVGLPTPPRPGPVFAGRGTAIERMNSSNNLKQIALGLLNHHDALSAFPYGIYDATGKVGLSWRVAILPYIEQDGLYKEFKLDEPWDSDHNKKLIAKMPKTYAPNRTETNGYTYYRAFTGPDAALAPPRPGQKGRGGQPALSGRRLFDITDGTSNTWIAAEAADPVVWTKPDELEYDAKKPVPRLGGMFGEGYHVAYVDGTVRFVSKTVPEATVRGSITARGGEAVVLP